MNTQTKRKTLYTAYNNLYKYCKRLDLKVSDTFRKRAIECLHKMSDEQINELYKQYKENDDSTDMVHFGYSHPS